MTELATKPTAANDDVDFSASAYDLPVPRMDGRKATNLEIRFSGSGVLDRTSEDDLELLKAARLGKPIRLIVVVDRPAEANLGAWLRGHERMFPQCPRTWLRLAHAG